MGFRYVLVSIMIHRGQHSPAERFSITLDQICHFAIYWHCSDFAVECDTTTQENPGDLRSSDIRG
ncbi:hypothetical protein BDR03DRAFT_969744 [Suillus americanus]|nr:hypothetical protein BDR03DRAFT_969744 [Suillus americanus]